MVTVLTDFEKRVTEIDLFFKHLENLEEDGALLYFPNRTKRKIQAHNNGNCCTTPFF